jgi:hypothetical protein
VKTCLDAEVTKTLVERPDLLLDERLHGRDIDDLERVEVDNASLLVAEALNGAEDGEDSDVGLWRASTCKPS